MRFEEHTVESIQSIIGLMRQEQVRCGNTRVPLLRGEKRATYRPTASVFRSSFTAAHEQDILTNFARQLPLHHPSIDMSDTLSVMTLAQHHGAPTRLLDWTRSPLAATYFACEGRGDEDAAVWMVWGLDTRGLPIDPLSISTIHDFTPLALAARVQVQDSQFTIHPDGSPIEDHLLDEDVILKLIIPANLRMRLLVRLDSSYGMSRKTLFPDLDGLGAYLRWRTGSALSKLGAVPPTP